MTVRRFRVEKSRIREAVAFIEDPGEMRHILRVLRLRPGDRLILFDGEGGEYPASIQEISREQISFSLEAERPGKTAESPLRILLGLSLLKGPRFEWVLQKATELGAAEIVPFLPARAVPQWRKDHSRAARWEKIVSAAVKQSGRAVVPRLHPPLSFPEALSLFPEAGRIFLWKEGAGRLAEALLAPVSAVYALVGPEGGFSSREGEEIQRAGFRPVRLGPRVLRAETAAMVITGLLQFLYGDLG